MQRRATTKLYFFCWIFQHYFLILRNRPYFTNNFIAIINVFMPIVISHSDMHLKTMYIDMLPVKVNLLFLYLQKCKCNSKKLKVTKKHTFKQVINKTVVASFVIISMFIHILTSKSIILPFAYLLVPFFISIKTSRKSYFCL